MNQVEKIFGGVLALVVLLAALFWVFGPKWPPGGGDGGDIIIIDPLPGGGGAVVDAGADVLCRCFDEAYRLSGDNVDVMSSQYRTGFESCRAVAGARGGEAWTAGWNARVSAKSYQASCPAFLRNG